MSVERVISQLDAMLEQGAEFDALLETAVRGLHELDSRFHWTGIYELFPDNVLRLGPFIGAPTDHVFIAVGRGICGCAVAENRNINVPDVSKAPNYLACSTQTRSELVVLIRSGRQIFAQVDIDSHELNAFDPDTVTLVEEVADWLAGAYVQASNAGVLRSTSG